MKKEELVNKWQEKVKWYFESMKMNEDNMEHKMELAAKIDVYNDVILDLKKLELKKPELPVIPQFVAGYIESKKNVDDTFAGTMLDFHDFRIVENINKYINENYETFARAWLDGYTVEKEKLYKVELPIDRIHHILTAHEDGSGHFFGKEHTNNSWYRTHLTEREIKAIDERYWAFAEEVTDNV